MSEKVAAVFHLGVIGWGRSLGLNRGGGKRVLSPRRVPLAVGAQLQHPDPARRQLGDEGLEMGPVLHVHVEDWSHFQTLISELPASGIRVLELSADRKRDAAWRKDAFASAAVQA